MDRESLQAATATSEEVAVRVVDLAKRYQKHFWKSKSDLIAVSDLSFTVQKGEIFCLLGHNGVTVLLTPT